ncbi:FadR family transcriptional regulator [Streptomyces malaysiensis subsp. malaysiensis]|uniref:FadR/GntR family transcriptional regulator n=1 Tax=Streptomyces malaysiensis TaxID=92644 RepID=UPI000BFE9078|nr:FCD domain-containing protein [Streptomyces malaysiensis]ATL87725.1 GntR family transcriptional regulator [Streptomyces malaysiensis]QDL68904.1 FadR family transcriptional regulator [Streptomyces malaysiensis]
MAIQEPSGAPSALTSSALAAIRRTSAVDTVRARISLAVDLGLLAPGERLPNVQATAAALGVGEITVRRALRTLEDEGVVQRRPGRTGGTFIAERPRRRTVAQVAAYREDSERVHRLIDERIVLEAGFAHLAAERLDRPGLGRLDQCVREMDAAGSWAEFHAGDKRFHLALAEAAGLPSALAMYERVTGELYAYFLPYPLDYLRGSNEQHKAIRAALGARDAALAAGLLRDHVTELHHSMYVGFADSDNDNTQRGDDG